MYKDVLFQKKVDALTSLLFFIGMLILIFMDWLPIWAAAIASAFVALTLRQFMAGHLVDIFVSLILFALLFLTNTYYMSELWTGILLIVGSGYVFIRQCFEIYKFKNNQKISNCLNRHQTKTCQRDLDEDDPGD